ncbi:MAG: anti-sigma factor family protein [Gemmatimonadales bacterium]
MTGWIKIDGTPRHIPEDELHAYLDQALSRSQCVEIECHLAECRQCRHLRDDVAAVRDRITALLAETALRRVAPIPPYERIVARHQARRSAMVSRVRRVGLLAAGLIGAVGFGWWAQGGNTAAAPTTVAVAAPEASSRTLVAAGPVALVAHDSSTVPTVVGDRPEVEETGDRIPLVRDDTPTLRAAPVRPQAATPVVQVSAVAADEESFGFEGLWQSVDWQQAREETSGNLPRISGLPILDIQLQQISGEERPIVVVIQQHPSGRLIRTVEGPIERIEQMLDRYAARTPSQVRASSPALTPPDYVSSGAGTPRRLRILSVIANFPADSLNAMARAIDIRE